MPINAQRHTGIRGVGWLEGIAGILLLISAGFELLAHQAFGQTSMATLLLALYLAFWCSVLGFAGVLVLSVRWLLGLRHPKDPRAALNRSHSVRPDDRPFEALDPEGHQYSQSGMNPVARGRLSTESNDKAPLDRFTRVA